MKISELIAEYRASHGLSQRQFAVSCGLSNGYISMIENEINPKTGLPVQPSLVVLKKIADGMGMTLADLFSQADDISVDISAEENEKPTYVSRDGLEEKAMQLFEALPEEQRAEAVRYLQYLAEKSNNQ